MIFELSPVYLAKGSLMKRLLQLIFLCFSMTACGPRLQLNESNGNINDTRDSEIKAGLNQKTEFSKVQLSHPKPIVITELDTLISGPKQVTRWEPSGVVSSSEGLWVVSDREGWITYYTLPLSPKDNQPKLAFQLKPKIENRIKWEGLEWAYNDAGEVTALLLLEAISRSIWHCDSPHEGCPRLNPLPMEPLNQQLNQAVPRPFKYIMFEGLAFYQQEYLIGVRAFQDKEKGLSPWSLLANQKGELSLDARTPLEYEGKTYGISGATFDSKLKGFWLTWSYEEEAGSTREAVRGLLTFSPLREEANQAETANQEQLRKGTRLIDHEIGKGTQLCAIFHMKPEGVTVNDQDQLFVVFDEDLDRKDDETPQTNGRFKLKDHQDFIYQASTKSLLDGIASPKEESKE